MPCPSPSPTPLARSRTITLRDSLPLRRVGVEPKPRQPSMLKRLIERLPTLRQEVHPLAPTVPQRLCDEPSANPLPPPMACDGDQRQMGLHHPIALHLGKAHDCPALDGNDRVDAWSRQGAPGEVTICGVRRPSFCGTEGNDAIKIVPRHTSVLHPLCPLQPPWNRYAERQVSAAAGSRSGAQRSVGWRQSAAHSL